MGTPFFIILSSLAVLLPLLIGTFRRLHLSDAQSRIWQLVMVNTFFQGMSYLILFIPGVKTNHPVFHIGMTVEFLMILRVYMPMLGQKIPRQWILGFGILFVLSEVAYILFFNPLTDFPSLIRTQEGILSVLLAAFYFFTTMQKASEIHLERQAMFWFSSGLLLFFASSLLFSIYSNLILQQSDEVFAYLHYIQNVVNILMYIAYAIALSCKEKKLT